jgi:hypothetical protein
VLPVLSYPLAGAINRLIDLQCAKGEAVSVPFDFGRFFHFDGDRLILNRGFKSKRLRQWPDHS